MFPRHVISVSGPDTTAFHMGQVKGNSFPGEKQQESSQLLAGRVLEAHTKQAGKQHSWVREFMRGWSTRDLADDLISFPAFSHHFLPCLPQACPMF